MFKANTPLDNIEEVDYERKSLSWPFIRNDTLRFSPLDITYHDHTR